MTDSLFAEFTQLCNARDLTAYSVVGAATVALAHLNLGGNDVASSTLLRALDDYRQADARINEFHQNAVRKHSQSEKENSSDGNRTAAA